MRRSAPIQQPKHTISTPMPPNIVASQQQHPLLTNLWLTDTGNFKRAKGHVWERNQAEVETNLIIYCLQGKGWFDGGGANWEVRPGDVIIARAGIAHSYGADTDDPWTIQWAHFDGKEVPQLLTLVDLPAMGGVISVGYQDSISTVFNDMLITLHAGFSQQHLLVATACLRYILSRIALTRSQSPSSRAGLAVERVINLMRRNISKRYRLDQLASHAKMPRSTFIRIFRQKTGYPPVEYFLRLKVQRACELLETTDLSIGQISRQLGYEDQYYFSRLFKKFMHLSPQNYRA